MQIEKTSYQYIFSSFFHSVFSTCAPLVNYYKAMYIQGFEFSVYYIQEILQHRQYETVLKLAFITDAANSLSVKCFNAYRTPLASSLKLQFSSTLHIMTGEKKHLQNVTRKMAGALLDRQIDMQLSSVMTLLSYL